MCIPDRGTQNIGAHPGAQCETRQTGANEVLKYITNKHQIAPDAILFGLDMFITHLKIYRNDANSLCSPDLSNAINH